MTLVLEDELRISLTDKDSGEIIITTDGDVSKLNQFFKEELFDDNSEIIYYQKTNENYKEITISILSNFKTNYGFIKNNLDYLLSKINIFQLSVNTAVGKLNITMKDLTEIPAKLNFDTEHLDVKIHTKSVNLTYADLLGEIKYNADENKGELNVQAPSYYMDSGNFYVYTGSYKENYSLVYNILADRTDSQYKLTIMSKDFSLMIIKQKGMKGLLA